MSTTIMEVEVIGQRNATNENFNWKKKKPK
jgi:hypothetical protein